MPLFRKRPVIVEASQWFSPGDHPKVRMVFGKAIIQTLEGYFKVSPGDWIITGVCGENYPCKPEIFEETYEPLEITDAP